MPLLTAEKHIPVMLAETIRYFDNPNGVYLDCTLGGGGHTQALLEKLPRAKVIAFDFDQKAIENCQKNLAFFQKIIFVNDNFANFAKYLIKLNVSRVDGFCFDLGVSSEQLNDIERGFSYRQNAPLDMRMNRENKMTAQDIINGYNYKKLADIFYYYGEERKARLIARKICHHRSKKKITNTQELVSIIASCFHKKNNKHPARKSFQALRIAVNQELSNLSQALEDAIKCLNINGKVVVISYHSLEDRIVKQMFKKYASDQSEDASYQILTKKPLLPTEEEVIRNHRARSAKLRVLIRYK